MKIRIIGISDHTVTVRKNEYLKAKKEQRLHEFMDPYIKNMPIAVTYSPTDN